MTAGTEQPTETCYELPISNEGQQSGEATLAAVDDVGDESWVSDDGFRVGLEDIDSVIREGERFEGLEDSESKEFLGEDERPEHFSKKQVNITSSEDSSNIKYATENYSNSSS